MKVFTQIINSNQEPLKALVLSDIHIYKASDEKMLNKIIYLVEKNRYDAIFIVGDIIDYTNILTNNKKIVDMIINFIQELGKRAKTYIVYGNHDCGYVYKNNWRYDIKTLEKKLSNNFRNMPNVWVLNNETQEIKEGYTISGYIPSKKYMQANAKENSEILYQELETLLFLKKLDPNKINTFLCHYPHVIEELNKLGYLNNIDVSIAGHNHNGVTQFLPLELLLNLIGEKNRGLITPGKSMKLSHTKFLRGSKKLNERNTLVINPCVRTFGSTAHYLRHLDFLFYRGSSEIIYKKVRK